MKSTFFLMVIVSVCMFAPAALQSCFLHEKCGGRVLSGIAQYLDNQSLRNVALTCRQAHALLTQKLCDRFVVRNVSRFNNAEIAYIAIDHIVPHLASRDLVACSSVSKNMRMIVKEQLQLRRKEHFEKAQDVPGCFTYSCGSINEPGF